MSPKQKRRRARHARRVVAANDAETSSCGNIFTRGQLMTMPHCPDNADIPKSVTHPTWDQLLDRIGMGFDDSAMDGRLKLRCWVHDLVLRPEAPQPTLLLTGPECSGKTTFHEAMGLLLPSQAVVRYSQQIQIGSKVCRTRCSLRTSGKGCWIMPG